MDGDCGEFREVVPGLIETMSVIVCALLLVIGTGCGLAGVGDYAVEVVSPRDSLSCAMEDKKLAVTIKSDSGIGRAEIGLKKEGVEWPEAVVLSIQTKDGKPLRGLEGFSIAGQTIRINGSRRTSGEMDCHDVTPKAPKAPKKNPRKVKVVVKKTEKAMTVTIPGKLLKGESKVRIQWIDFYR